MAEPPQLEKFKNCIQGFKTFKPEIEVNGCEILVEI
jgi:hypothetical protein